MASLAFDSDTDFRGLRQARAEGGVPDAFPAVAAGVRLKPLR